jgi:hypothetical protein
MEAREQDMLPGFTTSRVFEVKPAAPRFGAGLTTNSQSGRARLGAPPA